MVMLEKIVMGSVAMAESCRIAKNYRGCHTESVYYLDRPHCNLFSIEMKQFKDLMILWQSESFTDQDFQGAQMNTGGRGVEVVRRAEMTAEKQPGQDQF